MVDINLNNIRLGSPSRTGHEVYVNAQFSDPQYPDKKRHVIFKKNKHGLEVFSQLEVAFSNMAQLFFDEDSTSNQHLVVDDENNIMGLMVEHICYVISNKEQATDFFKLTDLYGLKVSLLSHHANTPEEIPIYFFNRLPQGFFTRLQKAKDDGLLTINYASLANVLAGSYFLEEDDLHKANFGFYITNKNGRPEVVFFKIDHDLMFVDSIMSFYSWRPYHFFHGAHAFDIAAVDLLGLSHLKVSSNSYWPGKLSRLSNPWDNKEFHDQEEVNAFASLSSGREFNDAIKLRLCRYLLTPDEVINSRLDKSKNRAQVALINHSVIARKAHLKAVWFSHHELRSFFKELTQDQLSVLIKQILLSYSSADRDFIHNQIVNTINDLQAYCSNNELNDTPLHTAIKLGDYRYEESMRMFGQFVNSKDGSGRTPLDLTLDLYEQSETKHNVDIRKNLCFTMKNLLQHGAIPSERFRRFNLNARVEYYRFPTQYMTRVASVKEKAALYELLQDIGEDHRYCLKFKKNLAKECISHYIRINHEDSPQWRAQLMQIKNDIDSSITFGSETSGLKFICQLRSKLWIVRQIRGHYGWTTTQANINDSLDVAMDRIKLHGRHSISFFGKSRSAEYDSVLTSAMTFQR
ncbi:MAG: hypothetical protein Q8M40_12830 [Legionella sp.]|nr:hypothetical protein [Legionella sp.]